MNPLIPLIMVGAALNPAAAFIQGGSYSASYTNVSASGGSSASASVHTTMTGNTSGGTSVVNIETSSNGQEHTAHYENTVPPGAPLVISVTATSGGAVVSTSTSSAPPWPHVAVPTPHHPIAISTSTSTTASSSISINSHASTSMPFSLPHTLTQGVLGHVGNFFSNIWGFFKL